MKPVFKILVVIFAGLVLFPSAVDFAHVFLGHQHSYCNHYSDSHFHQKDLDCDIFKLQQSSYPAVEFATFDPFPPEIKVEKDHIIYYFLSKGTRINLSLRAPPSELILS